MKKLKNCFRSRAHSVGWLPLSHPSSPSPPSLAPSLPQGGPFRLGGGFQNSVFFIFYFFSSFVPLFFPSFFSFFEVKICVGKTAQIERFWRVKPRFRHKSCLKLLFLSCFSFPIFFVGVEPNRRQGKSSPTQNTTQRRRRGRESSPTRRRRRKAPRKRRGKGSPTRRRRERTAAPRKRRRDNATHQKTKIYINIFQNFFNFLNFSFF